MPAPARLRGSTDISPNFSATACWPISAIRLRTKTPPKAPCARRLPSSTRLGGSGGLTAAAWKPASASQRDWSLSAIAIEPTFSFRHALTRDVAYDSLLRSRRQQLHERIARTLEERFPALV